MARWPQEPAAKGSKKWLQILVNERTDLINTLLATSLQCVAESIRWRSPLKDDDYAEYSDQEFVDRLGVSLKQVPLKAFWPRNGPHWDALANTDRREVILVEAKAHIPELVSDPTAAGESSLPKILDSLSATKQFIGSHSQADWSTCFYQYTNRLAHLYLLRKLNKLPAYLLFVYFLNDKEMGGPTTKLEWEAAIALLEEFLGIRERHSLSAYVVRAFVDVELLKSAAA